jgi:hypothetical protein
VKKLWVKRIDNSADGSIIKLEDIVIGKSVGEKAKNYDILDLQTGEHFNFVEGTHLQNVEVFAGKCVKTEYRKAYVYANKYGGLTENWQHCKSNDIIDYYGEERNTEVHWSQCERLGKHDFFIKRWLE